MTIKGITFERWRPRLVIEQGASRFTLPLLATLRLLVKVLALRIGAAFGLGAEPAPAGV